jgi:DNA-binding IclR family transcriptional regulator
MGEVSAEKHGIQAVETAGRLLRILAASRKAMALSEISLQANMPRAQVYRYLVSLRRLELVTQDPISGNYEFGPFASDIGLLRLTRLDAVQAATLPLQQFAEETGHSVQLTVLGSHGPTVIRWVQGALPIAVNLRLGHSLPLLTSASGRAFVAFLPRSLSDNLIRAELAKSEPKDKRTAAERFEDVQKMLEEFRSKGITRVRGMFSSVIYALSAPVYDATGIMKFAVTAVGNADVFDDSLDGPIARALKKTSEIVSRQLGYVP